MKRFISVAAAAFILASSITLGSATSASAHDEIIATTPTADANVAPGQVKVSITFNEPVMQMGNNEGIEIQVTGPDGSATVLPCLMVDGATIWALDDTKTEGTYVVDWRSVSNDGHANSGSFNFVVAAGASPAGASAAEASQVAPDCVSSATIAGASPESIADATPMAANEASQMAADSVAAPASGGSKLDPLVGLGIGIGLLIVLSVLGALAAELQKRRRASKAAQKKLKAEIEANPDLLRDL